MVTLSPFLIPNFFNPFAALETFWCSCLYDIFWVSFGSSPTQIIAVLSFLSFRCLSIQFAEAFKVPSSNHLILTSSLLYLTSLIFLYGLIQFILFPSFFQNALLFLMDSLYLFWYWDLFAKLDLIHSGRVLKINSWDELSISFFFLGFKFFILFFFFYIFSFCVIFFFIIFIFNFASFFFRMFSFNFGFFLFFFVINNFYLNLTHIN